MKDHEKSNQKVISRLSTFCTHWIIHGKIDSTACICLRNAHTVLSWDAKYSSKLAVFLELRSRWTVRFLEKYNARIFLHLMAPFVYRQTFLIFAKFPASFIAKVNKECIRLKNMKIPLWYVHKHHIAEKWLQVASKTNNNPLYTEKSVL